MGVKDLFSHGRTISRNLLSKNYRNDRIFQKKVMSDPKLRRVFDRPEEQREFHNKIMEKARDGSVSGDDMREIAYDLTHGGGENISNEEGREAAREIFPDSSRRYKTTKPETAASSKNATKDSPVSKLAKIPPSYLTYRDKFRHSYPGSGNPEKKKASFFNSLRSVARNQK